VMPPGFRWTTFDLTSSLSGDWQQEIAATAADADFHQFPRTPILSREAQDVQRIYRGRVHAAEVRQNLPWLYRLYREHFLELAQETCAEPVVAARDERYGIVLNVQRGNKMRFECHIDSNPLTGLLFCTDHLAGAGGELVFAHDPDAADIETIERDCSVIRPHSGHLIFFDGRNHPHYARPLASASDVRIVAVMNFYTESCPESTRPQDLNLHLFGQVLTAGRRHGPMQAHTLDMGQFPFALRPAAPADQGDVRALVRVATQWLRQTKSTDQWGHRWPDRAGQRERILNDLLKGNTWMLWDGPVAAATITVDPEGPLDLNGRPVWPEERRQLPALYLRRVVVDRRYAGLGLGAALMDWAATVAAREYHAELLRVDVWTTNLALHAYYEGLGFTRRLSAEGLVDYPSQALFERPADQSRSDFKKFFSGG
jgi:GNAT superfamily N-acetyltransferase